MLSYLKPDGCEGCEDRAEIMGSGTWQVDAMVLGISMFLILVIVYLQK